MNEEDREMRSLDTIFFGLHQLPPMWWFSNSPAMLSSRSQRYKQHKGPARMPVGYQVGARATHTTTQIMEETRPVRRHFWADSNAKRSVSSISVKNAAEYQVTAWLYLSDTPKTMAATRP